MALYTFRIRATSTAALDGTTPFAGTFVQDPVTGIFEAEIVGPFGIIDLHNELQVAGRALTLNSATVENTQAVHTAGSEIVLIAPNRVDGSEGTRRTIQALGGTSGIIRQVNAVIPIDHRMAITTAADGAQGPHTVQLTVGTFSELFLDQNAGVSSPESSAGVPVGLTWVALQTTNYLASSNERVLVDASGGTFTVTMPVAPATGDRVAIKVATADITLLTIAGNGNNVENPIGSYAPAASVSAGGDGAAVTWSFDGTTWEII